MDSGRKSEGPVMAVNNKKESIPVPVVDVHLKHQSIKTPTKNYESFTPEIRNYFLKPEDAVGSPSPDKGRMSFLEALRRMIF